MEQHVLGASAGQLKSIEAHLADSTLPTDLRPFYEAKKKKTGELFVKCGFRHQKPMDQDVNFTQAYTNHRIHGNGMYLHLVDFYGKCRSIHRTWILWDSISPVSEHDPYIIPVRYWMMYVYHWLGKGWVS